MYNESDLLRLKFISEMIDTIRFIGNRHRSIKMALEDKEGQPALLMCMLQIGETLNKLKDEKLISMLPVSAAYTMRNIISHDYLGVDLSVIETTIMSDVPILEKKVRQLISDLEKEKGH